MEIERSGSQPSGKGPAEYFAGAVRVAPLFDAYSPALVFGANVTFEPAARTAWHSATPSTAMTHIAIVEKLDSKSADWMEKVSDEQYQAGFSTE